ncbi:MAG TPA: recombinase RecT [Bacteroidia bacterium]|nr:recombinase RecT [Bacteroidia bacterium]
MSKTNTAVQTTQTQAVTKPKDFFSQENVKSKFTELMGKRATGYITSVLQAVNSNQLLSKADINSIYQAAVIAALLDLPINPNLGFAYIIPYNQKDGDSWKTVAQFQMGYKGFIQLAQRSGQFKTISATPIYKGQLKSENPLTGYEFDFTVKPSGDPIGYASYFSLLNGFEKTLYMTVEELKKHGTNYSQTFKKGYGQWKDNFDAMAQKTVIKLLLSKFAPLSIEMQKAVVTDQSVINNAETEDVSYTDAEPLQIESKETERIMHLIDDCVKVDELEVYRNLITSDVLEDAFNQKYHELGGK